MQINRPLDQWGKHYRYPLTGRLGAPLKNYINGGERSFNLARELNFETRGINAITPFFLLTGRSNNEDNTS